MICFFEEAYVRVYIFTIFISQDNCLYENSLMPKVLSKYYNNEKKHFKIYITMYPVRLYFKQ